MRITIFFSRYDRDCKELINLIKNSNQNLSKLINPACIDFKEINDIIRTSTNINISTVPTLLVENNDQLEIYEGEGSFQYIEQVIQNINSASAKQKEKTKVTDISDLWVEDTDNTEKKNIPPGVVDDRKKITAKDIEKERQADIVINSPRQETNRY